MASIPVTLVGVAYTDKSLNATPVTIVADLSYSGLAAGMPLPGGPPLGTWGGGGVGPYPDAGLPGPQPGGPVGIWGGPYYPPIASQGPGFPTNPIVIPRPPVEFPTPPTEGAKPPPDSGGWGYSPEYGWGYFPMGSAAGPKA